MLLTGCATPRPTPHVTASSGPTGIASCDAYLSSYLACHRAAGIFPADQLQAHYQSMRDSLQAAARDPLQQPYLDARCQVLSTQLQASLKGRSCSAAAR